MADSVELSVIIPTHNPNAGRLQRTLAGLLAQSLPAGRWEIILVDNASTPPVGLGNGSPSAPANLRLVRETQLGLSAARRRGFAEARGEIIIMVDDDNVLATDYLEKVSALFTLPPRVGALGGTSVPEFETPPPAWAREFDGLIACRNLGQKPKVSSGLWNSSRQRNEYPEYAPIGAGMALRRSAAMAWLSAADENQLSDRQGDQLTSGGDNDIVFSLMEAGWEVAYFPELVLIHLIPSIRSSRDYLARLNRAIARSWIQVLSRHQACPWKPVAGWTVPLRQIKAWFTTRAWAGPFSATHRYIGGCSPSVWSFS